MTQLTVVSEKLDMVRPLISDAIKKEIAVIELGIKETRKMLQQFERKYRMKSGTFYANLTRGKLKENLDFIEWEGEYETLKRLQEQIRELKGAKIEYG
jgi:hypothetical protein